MEAGGRAMAAVYRGRWRMTGDMGVGPRPGAMVRQISDDAVRRGRDQEPEEGELVCRLAQTGADRWHGTTPDGRRVAIRRISDGSLEIRHLAEGAGEAGDNVFGQEDPPGAASSLDQLRRRMAPRAVHDRQLTSVEQTERLRAWREYNDKIWEPRS
jgi:hypothetical protein